MVSFRENLRVPQKVVLADWKKSLSLDDDDFCMFEKLFDMGKSLLSYPTPTSHW